MNHLIGISAHVLTKHWFPGEMWLYFICVTAETLVQFQWQDHCICILYSCQYSALEILINMAFTKYLEFLGSKMRYKASSKSSLEYKVVCLWRQEKSFHCLVSLSIINNNLCRRVENWKFDNYRKFCKCKFKS